MPGKVTLVRPDGSVLDASPEQASKLKLLGYREEALEERTARNAAAAEEEFYSTPGQQARAGGAAFVRGATAGLSDYAFADEHTRARAEHNPGISLAMEALGTVAPLAMSGGTSAVSTLARATPTSLISGGSKALAKATGIEGRLGRAVVGGGIEGGIYGGAQAANHAYLSGDPITAEAVLHGAKWGGIFGAGIGAVGEGIAIGGEKAASHLAAKKAAAEAVKQIDAPVTSVMKVAEPAYGSMAGEVKNLSSKLDAAAKAADAVMAGTNTKLAKLGETSNIPSGELAVIRKEIKKAYRRVGRAVNSGDAAKAEKAIAKYEEAVKYVSQKLGMTSNLGNPAMALNEIASIKAVNKELANFPKSVESFAGMTAARAEKLFAALENAKKLSAYPELGKAIEQTANKLGESLGLAVNGTEGLRSTWKTANEALKLERTAKRTVAQENTKEAVKRSPSLGFGGGYALYSAARGVTGSAVGGLVGAGIIRSIMSGETLAAMRTAVIGRIQSAAAKYSPQVSRAVKAVGPRVEPLAVKLDGSLDNSTKDRKELAMARVKEMWDAYPSINDTVFRGVEGLGVTQPELAPAVHAAAVAAFKGVLADVPRDPGVVSGLKSIWKPSDIQAETLARRLAVFHDPVGEAESMLATGNFDPIKVKTLKVVAPAIYEELRQGVLERISEPGVMEKMTYRDQIGVGTMLDIAIHSSMRPEHIAASQQLFLERSEPLPMPVTKQEGSNGGRPSAADNPNATRSQKITDR